MNQYHIYEAIGRGKHSTVYKGRRKKSIEYYAIKSVDKSQKNKVLQEVRTLHSLDHPNVLKFYAWYETSAHLWLVLEYCVGGDLLTLLKQDARLPEESVHDFARDLVQALQFLHSKGVVYCDVKPSNILLDENGRLKLCDFGLARRLSEISKNSVQQLPQAKRGTPCYMAPELFQEGGVHSFGSDLWALGCVIYECYAGRPPFVSSSFTQLVNSILNEEPAPLCGSPSKEFEDLVKHLLIKDPAERIQWPELRDHCFWRSKLKQLPLPPQPAFATFLKSSQKQPKAVNGLQNGVINGEVAKGNVHGQRVPKVENQQIGADKRTAESTVSSKASTTKRAIAPVPFKEVSCKANIGVNLLRLSKIVKSNLQREAEGEAYRQPSSKGTVNDADFTLENNDQELDFAERGENDVAPEDEDGSAEPSAPEEKNEQVSCVGETENVDSDEIHGNDSPKNREEPAMERQPDETLKIESLRLEVAATPPGVGISRKGQRACGIVGERKKAPLPPSEDSSKTSVSLSQALWHPSDVSVRPIMSNRKVEKSPDAMFDPKVLCVDPLTCLDILKLQPEQIEAFLGRIINNIAGAASPSSKSTTFRYVESICNNTDVSNLIINGPLMPLMVKTLRTTKVANLRIQIATIIGLLIRHATTIEDELAGSGIVAVLTETLRDSHEKVRRGAMAALGELLFYISTQNSNSARAASAGNESSAKESRSPSVWQVSGTTISLVASVLHKGEDDATQHYALKAIENIACQGGEWVMRFATHGVLEDLCYIFKTTSKQEALRTTAGSCLVRLVRFNPSSIPLVLEKLTFSKLISGLSKGSIKLQQVYLNLLNMALVGSSVMTNMQKHLLPLMEEKSLVPSIVNMLEQGPEVLRGKSLVCAALLCKINRKWLHSLCSGKLLPVVERLAKEKDPYVQQCLEALIQTVISLVPVIMEGISLDIQQVGQQLKRPGSAFQNASPFGKNQARSSIPLLPTILLLLKCIPFKDRIVNEQVLKQVASFMTRLETASFQGQEDFQSTVLRMLEVISQQSTTLLTYVDIFISHVLPSLASLYRKNSCGDTRFLCLKVFCDILIVFVDDMTSNLEDLKVDPGERSGIWGKERDHLKLIIRQHFLPLYPILLEDEDPIPMYAQKLLVMLLDLKCIEIADILQLKLVSQFFDFLQEDRSSINLHNVRLCLFVVCSSEVETKLLSKLHVVNKLMALLEFAHAKGMEDFLDPVLTVCRYFLIRNAGKHKGTTNGNLIAASNGLKGGHSFEQNMLIEDIADFARNAGLFLELCGSHEPRLAESASECLVLAVKAAPKVAAESILSNISELTKALETSSLIHNPALLSLLQRRLLQVLTVACREQRMALVNSQILPAPVLQTSTIVPLENIIHKLRKSSLPHVADAAIDAALELQLLPGRT